MVDTFDPHLAAGEALGARSLAKLMARTATPIGWPVPHRPAADSGRSGPGGAPMAIRSAPFGVRAEDDPLGLDAARAYLAAAALRPAPVGVVGLELERHVVDVSRPSAVVGWARLLGALRGVALRRNSRSRSSMLRDRSSSARAAVSHSIRHRTRSRRPCRSSVNSLSRRVRGMERSPRRAGLRRSSRRPIFIDAVGWLRERLDGRELLQVADPPDLPLMIEPRLAPLGVPLHTRRISDLQLLGHEVQHRQWHIQRILQKGPDPADRHQLEREPELHVLAAMTVDQRPRSSSSRKNTRSRSACDGTPAYRP